MAGHLRIASADDAEKVCPHLIEAAEYILAEVKAGRVGGLYAVLEYDHGGRAPVLSGRVDPDGLIGYTVRYLTAVADQEGEE